MCAKAVKNRSTGYYEIGLAENTRTVSGKGHGQHAQSADAPAACSQCRHPFTLSELSAWRECIVTQPIIGLNGERDFDPAWQAIFGDADCPRLCCRREFLSFVPEDVWAELYRAANFTLPPDWTLDLYVKTRDVCDDDALRGAEFGTTASASHYYMRRARSRGVLI